MPSLCLLLWILTAGESIPRPEHPRPDAVREQWLNLNGAWEFAETDLGTDRFLAPDAVFPDHITVPFCRESTLSGLHRTGFVKNVWYRRAFTVPPEWRGKRVLLHVQACDWRTRVFVNGEPVGTHTGGSAAFVYDVTSQLTRPSNTLVIHAYDDARSGLQALGKQSDRAQSHGIFYTRTTGIWQTVWLEAVGDTYVERFTITPHPHAARVQIQVDLNASADDITLTANAFADGKPCGSATAPAAWRNTQLEITLDTHRRWSPQDPFLYDLELIVQHGPVAIDRVRSYFGLRTVTLQGSAVLLDGEPIFERLVLDQGFYADGVWTAPSDAALRRDIELSQSVGMNGARLHQKVFEPRFLYWADRLGYLVWGEFPSYGASYGDARVQEPIVREWAEIVERDRNHPALIGWCPFNETPAEAGALQDCVLELTRAIDPSRPVIDTSGWSHSYPRPEILDAHDYDQNPTTFAARWEASFRDPPLPARYGVPQHSGPFFISEFGGIGWYDANGTTGAWGYGNQPKTIDDFHQRFAGLVNALLDNRHLFGFCYTQLTDVEQERNGLFAFDRTPKFDVARLRGVVARQAAYERDPPLELGARARELCVLVGAAADGALADEWAYTLASPATDWLRTDFDDRAWSRGRPGFGQKAGWEERTGTPWSTSDIWLRRHFAAGSARFDVALLALHYDNATEVYVNGQLLWRGEGWNDAYAGFDVTEPLRAALHPGDNVIAIHCHQDTGGQFIDAALLVAASAER
ncbi:MAG: glycoside hydrolase family 2 TIM barrel-domain containing protein [Planctomycetota bacterium]